MSTIESISIHSQGPKTAISRRRSAGPKRAGPSSQSSQSASTPSSPKNSFEPTYSEDFLVNSMIPVSKQPTHRKNDYATILSLLKYINPESPLIKSLDEAENVERNIGSWFLVRGCERSVVKLGIGANPGLKKYYWRANSSKRLLKREMEDGSEEASLVYIIQKASPVSKRCASIPDTDIWLVMYLPATLRAASDVVARHKSIGPSRRFPGPSSSPVSPLASPIRKRSRMSDDDDYGSSSDSSSSFQSSSSSSSSCESASPVAAPLPVPVVRASSSSELAPASPKRQRSPKKFGPSHRSDLPSPAAPIGDLHDISTPYDMSDDCIRSCESELPLFSDCQFGDTDMSIFASPDPFLPLAGSQTIFSAAIEAACMSGLHAPWMTSPVNLELSEFVF